LPYVGYMDDKREEIYERIPWETLEKPSNDRQWLVIGVAAAVVVGALAYSFVSNRTIPPPASADTPAMASLPESQAPIPAPIAPVPTAPQVVAEADLFAVPPQRLADSAAAHAEWFVIEYLTADGTEEGQSVLRSLLPADVPLPVVPEGTVVFVEWVRAVSIDEVGGPGQFSIDVLARYMIADDGQQYRRVQPEIFTVLVNSDDIGDHVLGPPQVRTVEVGPAAASGLVDVPAEIIALVAQLRPDSRIVGGIPYGNGAWEVTIMSVGPGAISRPETLTVSP
jgi:hypothetical protein